MLKCGPQTNVGHPENPMIFDIFDSFSLRTVSGSVPSKAEGEPEAPVAEDHQAGAEDHHDEKQDKGSFFSRFVLD
jgi:hypothetical protein